MTRKAITVHNENSGMDGLGEGEGDVVDWGGVEVGGGEDVGMDDAVGFGDPDKIGAGYADVSRLGKRGCNRASEMTETVLLSNLVTNISRPLQNHKLHPVGFLPRAPLQPPC